jgi:hypothetical protein
MANNPNQGNFANMPLLTQAQVGRGFTVMADTEAANGSSPQTVALTIEQIAVGEFGYLAAAGSTQGGATAIASAWTIVTVTASTEGVRLPVWTFTGQRRIVSVPGTVGVKVYPGTANKFDGSATNASVALAFGKTNTFLSLKDGKTWLVVKSA